MNEARYARLTREFPERAEVLFAKNEAAALERFRETGHAMEVGERWRLTPEGFLVSNLIIGEVLEIVAEEKQRRDTRVGRGLSRPVPHHRLRPLRDALHQGRHDELPDRNQARCRVRLLEHVPVQSLEAWPPVLE